MTDGDATTQLQIWLNRLQAGETRSLQGLIDHTYDRLRHLTRRMLSGFPGVAAREQTDDVLQNAAMRLWLALNEQKPKSPREFFGLAARQIYWELLDLARRYRSAPERSQATSEHRFCENHVANPDIPVPTDGPLTLMEWTELHEHVQRLPDELREVFDLYVYHGLSQSQIATILGVVDRTVKRRWREARLVLYRALHGEQPGT